MSTYTSLIRTIFEETGLESDDTPLALIPDLATLVDETGQQRAVPAFPTEVLPEFFEQRLLSPDHRFPVEAAQVAVETGSKLAFAFPPLLGRTRPPEDWRREHAFLGVAEVLAQCLLEPTDDSLFDASAELETLVVLIPGAFLLSGRTGQWRQQFFPAHSAVIIEHAPLELGTIVPMATVVFRRVPGPIKFFKCREESGEVSADMLSADLARLMRQPAGKTRFGFVHDGRIEPRDPVTYDFYSDETTRLRNQPSALGQKVQLEEIADVITEFRPPVPNRDPGYDTVADFDFLSGRNIGADGRVYLDDLPHHDGPAERVTFLQDGDLCLRKFARESPDQGFMVGIYEGDGRSVAVGKGVIVVRPKPVLTPAQRQVLFAYLRSPIVGRLNTAEGKTSSISGLALITPSMLRDYQVPVADEELTSAVESLAEARAAFRDWENECLNAEQFLVLMEEASESRKAITKAGQLARQRFRAGLQVESLDFRIRTQFPLPLAFQWRETCLGSTDPYKRFRNILKAAEGFACFLAQASILMARSTGREISYLKTVSKRLNEKKSGTNFGDWFAILVEVNEAKRFRNMESTDPFFEITCLFDETEVQPSLKWLMDKRNDDSHGRISHTSITVTDADEAFDHLTKVFTGADFLTDYSLVFITETRHDALRKITQFEYRDLSGDNPLAPIGKGESERTDLETGSLYLFDRTGEPHLFRPFLHYLECPECHLMSTYFLDTYSGQGDAVGLKSFERGSIRTEKFAEHFRIVGLM